MYLSAESVQKNLETTILAKTLQIHKSAESTNDLAWDAAKKNQDEGFTILAEQQTGGRGRLGRKWFAPRASSILCSILLKPPQIVPAPALTVGAALAVCRAVELNSPAKCRVKWPNDVLLNGKKLAGILVESRSIGKNPPSFVVGIGVNINLSKAAFPKDIRDTATSLRAETKKMYDRNPIITEMINELDRSYVLIKERHWGGLEVEFFERLSLADQYVHVKTSGKSYRGILRGFSILEGITLEMGETRKLIPCEHVLGISTV